VSTTPVPGSAGGPEYLDSTNGRPTRPPREPRPGARRRTALVVGGVVGVLAVGGAGVWAWSFFSTGAQPAEALPAATLAYVSVDLDPSGGQKIEALRTLRKFPAFKDDIGLDTRDDVRRRIFEEVQDDGTCPDLDYGDDVEPWLGDRMAVAAVDTGAETPAPVLVLQVSDEEAADAGLRKLRDCGGDGSGAWSIAAGWALVGESQDVVDGIAADAADASLAGDDDFTGWTDKAGDAGIATAYVAPGAGAMLADNLGGLLGPVSASSRDLEQTTRTLEDFGGAAATVRFDDGALEVEMAMDAGKAQDGLQGSDRGDDVLATLPADTAAAIGAGFEDGWFGDLVGGLGASQGDLLDALAAQSGLELPRDVETLAGDSAALALGSGFDPQADDAGMQVALKVHGDPDAIEAVLDKVRPQLGPAGGYLDSDTDGDLVAIGPDGDYRASILADGGLGGTDEYRDVVRHSAEAAGIVFVNFDAGDDWLARTADGDAELAENLDPLAGLGVSGWLDGDSSHVLLRVTTD
jgi:hypothetical protein